MLPDESGPAPSNMAMSLPPGPSPAAAMNFSTEPWNDEEPNLIEDVTSRPRRTPQKRLEQMIEFDEQQAASVLKQWIHRGAAA